MQRLKSIFRNVDQFQRRRGFKIVACALVALVCGVVFGRLLWQSYDLDAQRRAIAAALDGKSLAKGDELALSLAESGTAHINGRTYGGEDLKEFMPSFFDEGGSIILPRRLAELLVEDQIPPGAPLWLLEQPQTTWMLAIIALFWALLVVMLDLSMQAVLVGLGTAIVAWLAQRIGGDGFALACLGIGGLTFTFLMLCRVAQVLLNRPRQVFSVAHTLIKEASRTRLSLVFIVLLLVLLPLLPLTLDPASPLRFRVQTFIARSLGVSFTLASCLTLLLACSSVAFEIRDRQIWQVMTKPVGRLQYLIGKWLGICVLNLILLLVAGVSTFTFIQYLRTLPVENSTAGQLDALQVRDEVLTARMSKQPDYPTLSDEQLRQRRDEMIRNDPDLARLEEVPLAVRRRIDKEIRETESISQRHILAQTGRQYKFTGLQRARELNSALSLQYRFHIHADDEHKAFDALFIFNNEEPGRSGQYQSRYVPAMKHTLPVPPQMILDDGTLLVTIVNLSEPSRENPAYSALNFEEQDFQLYYTVGTFEWNYLRAVLMLWTKLAFLAALGVAAATFLSFPVACLLSFTVFIAGTMSPFLVDALDWNDPGDASRVDWANVGMALKYCFDWVIQRIGEGLVFVLGSFGQYRPTNDLVEGRLIRWFPDQGGLSETTSVFSAALRLVIIWSSLVLAMGYLVLRRRELATYSGHG